MADDFFQRHLIPLSDDELASKSRLLAQCVVQLAVMKDEHAEMKKDMANDERQLVNQIRDLAKVVRDGAEERP